MPKRAKELGPLAVRQLVQPGRHMVGGVAGLALMVDGPESRRWVLRAMVGGKRRDMGLGAFPEVTLAEARAKAAHTRDQIRQGFDPVEESRARRAALAAERVKAMTFEQCAAAYVAAHRAGWKSDKHAQQWENTLAQWAHPILGHLLVKDVELPHVLAVLEQPADAVTSQGPTLWAGKTETASRLRGRIESVLDWAAARNLRHGENPARWRGHLDKLLPKPSKVAKVEHHAALPVAGVSEFMRRLKEVPGQGARALEFAVLTAARSGEVRGMTWAELDLSEGVWTVPAERMKAGKEHRVPLSEAAKALIKAQIKAKAQAEAKAPTDAETEGATPKRGQGTQFVFPGSGGRQLSDMSLTAVLRRMQVPVTAHGFRSTFRDWSSEHTSYPREVAEMALAHAIGDKVEAAYRRGDLFEKRRLLMGEWANFLASP